VADLTPTDRLQPCLLARLTNDEPGPSGGNRDRRFVSLSRYREEVKQHLEWLLNSRARAERERFDEFPLASRSVLNYGIRDLCGLTASGVSPEEIEREIREAIRIFEPRIACHSVSVRAVGDGEGDGVHNNCLYIEIEGELWAQPVPESLLVRTEVDLETGRVQVQGRANG